MAEGFDRTAQQPARLGHAEVGRLIDQHQVAAVGHSLDQNVIAAIARGKIKGPRRAEKGRGQALHLQGERAGAVARPAGRGVNPVTVQGFAGRPDHLRVAGEAQVAGAAEVQVFPAIDAPVTASGGPSISGGSGQGCMPATYCNNVFKYSAVR